MSGTIGVPHSVADITAEWIKQVMEPAALSSEIAAVAVSAIGTGQMASSVRVAIDYVDKHVDDPASVVVKLAATDPNSRAAGANGAYLREVRFYQELGAILPVATPTMYWASIDAETASFGLVLQDLRPATQGDQIAGCTAEQAQRAAENIAGLHAPHWADPALLDIDWLSPAPATRSESYEIAHAMIGQLVPGFIERYQDSLDAERIDLLQWFVRHTRQWLEHRPERYALTHADHRLDNLMFDPRDGAVTAVDWQTIGIRNPLADVAYLLGTGLDPALRRTCEHDIVGAYHRRLVELGVDDYDLQDCFDDYRAQSLHALLIIVLGSMLTGPTERGNAMFMAMLERAATQIADLDSCSMIS